MSEEAKANIRIIFWLEQAWGSYTPREGGRETGYLEGAYTWWSNTVIPTRGDSYTKGYMSRFQDRQLTPHTTDRQTDTNRQAHPAC